MGDAIRWAVSEGLLRPDEAFEISMGRWLNRRLAELEEDNPADVER